MTYPHEFKTRHKSDDTQTFSLSGNCADGNVTTAVNVPHGVCYVAVSLHAETHAKGVTVSIAPYVDAAQTRLGTSFGLLAPANAGPGVALITVAATATGSNQNTALVQPAKVPLGPAHVYSVYGVAVTIATTAVGGTGTWGVDLVVTEV